VKAILTLGVHNTDFTQTPRASTLDEESVVLERIGAQNGGNMERSHVSRREAIAMLGAAGAALMVGCGDNTPASPTTTTGGTTTGGGTTNAACAVTPTETIGPYPSLTDLIRSDIREGRSGATLTVTITVVNTNNNCAPVGNAQVEIWQCDATGNYSQYGSQAAQTFLRGIQTTDSDGGVTFTTIYPGWYQGRATHIHVEVVRNGSSAKVTQIAFPESTSATVYATGVYAARGSNPTSNTRDNIFADSLDSELATVSGDPASGLMATFRIGIAA
jgi:protocatechuate 3,4-dioxygenase beta subunit